MDFASSMKVFPDWKLYGTITEATKGWTGATYYAPNNSVYMGPSSATSKILKLNLTTGTATYIDTGVFNTPSVILAPNGFLYFIPQNVNSRIVKLNPATDTVALVGTLYASNAFYGACLAQNNCIYAQAQVGNSILKLDLSTDTTSLINGASTYALSHSSFSLGIDGKLYAAPRLGQTVTELDPSTDTLTYYTYTHTFTTNGAFGRTQPTSSGKIIFVPVAATQVGVFDVSTKATVLVGPVLPTLASPVIRLYPQITLSGDYVMLGNGLGYSLIFNGDLSNYSYTAQLSNYLYSTIDSEGFIHCLPQSAATQFCKSTRLRSQVITFEGAPPANLADLPTSNWNFLYNNL